MCQINNRFRILDEEMKVYKVLLTMKVSLATLNGERRIACPVEGLFPPFQCDKAEYKIGELHIEPETIYLTKHPGVVGFGFVHCFVNKGDAFRYMNFLRYASQRLVVVECTIPAGTAIMEGETEVSQDWTTYSPTYKSVATKAIRVDRILESEN